jgi:hypothetical protein
MKYFYLFTINLLLSLTTSANTDDEIKALVNKWNDLHNVQNMVDLVDFLDLYAPQVLFYSKNNTDEDCYFAKKRLFQSGFSQHIISPINIIYYNSGIVKADFTKRTSTGKNTKEHFCYLLFKEINGKYLITGESDNITDQKKNVLLTLGEPVINKDDNNFYKKNDSSSKASWLLFFVALLLFFSNYFYRKGKNKPIPYKQYSPLITEKPTPPLRATVAKVNKKVTTGIGSTNLESGPKKKGDDFEKYVVERFNKPCFKLTEWRSDKIHNGVYAASSRLPDLEYHFKTNHADCYFAVECKWRAAFFEGRIEWAKEYQLETYRKFSQEKKMEVFILIGIGGQPNQPQSLYIVPLRNIDSTQLYETQIQRYYRFSRSSFYFDADTLKLS